VARQHSPSAYDLNADMPVSGVCRLCKKPADLLESHLIPRSLYKHIRRSEVKTPRAITSRSTLANRIST
jgi:hypothetical protein